MLFFKKAIRDIRENKNDYGEISTVSFQEFTKCLNFKTSLLEDIEWSINGFGED
jgi:hypothetical protein